MTRSAAFSGSISKEGFSEYAANASRNTSSSLNLSLCLFPAAPKFAQARVAPGNPLGILSQKAAELRLRAEVKCGGEAFESCSFGCYFGEVGLYLSSSDFLISRSNANL